MSTTRQNQDTHPCDSEGGYVRVAVIATLIPLALIVGASSRLLVGNASYVREAVAESQAFLAAESGIDAAMFRATTGSLTDGHFTTDMGRGMTHRVSYFDLGIDGIDNDTDGVIDEKDEQVIRVLSVGLYGSSKTSLVAYLGRSIGISQTNGAVSILATPDVQIQDSAEISGINTNTDGTPADLAFSLPGLSTTAFLSPALAAQIDGTEAPRITGLKGSPSLGTGTSDVQQLISSYRQQATNVIADVNHEDVQWGDAASGEFVVSYASHLVVIKGDSSGAGVLIVEGELKVEGRFKFDGLVITTDYLQLKGDAEINGAVIVGPKRGVVHLHGNARVRYSKQAMDMVKTQFGSGQYTLLNGWQRVANH